MYYITLTVGDETLILDHDHGYDIATIDGLTGVTARLDTVQSNTDLGVAVQSGSVGGQKLVVRGYILDHNVAAKQALISLLKPMARGTIVVYNLPTGSSAQRPVPYRQTDFVVQTTPKITQTKHAKFSFELFQPNPTWRAMDATSILFSTDMTPVTVTVDGEAKADFYLITQLTTPIKVLNITVTTPDFRRGLLAFDFSTLNPDGVTGTMQVRRENGKLKATLGDTNIIPYIVLSHYMLEGLYPGENEIKAAATLDGTVVERPVFMNYYPSYVGVVLSGI